MTLGKQQARGGSKGQAEDTTNNPVKTLHHRLEKCHFAAATAAVTTKHHVQGQPLAPDPV